MAVCAYDLFLKLVSAIPPTSQDWVYQGHVSKNSIYRIAREFDFDRSRVLFVLNLSAKPATGLQYLVFLNAEHFKDQIRHSPK